ncbi:unnamed protein product [Sphenostylis stenocarpa]|uniref:Uncharacterized protein n=1 Tax=Sphenostylis stenocarpa TaxID=92480 RepID=A0AA86T3Q9_9FABA|nr:unnamed protein product [Sphenostylis stenocarpa]
MPIAANPESLIHKKKPSLKKVKRLYNFVFIALQFSNGNESTFCILIFYFTTAPFMLNDKKYSYTYCDGQQIQKDSGSEMWLGDFSVG